MKQHTHEACYDKDGKLTDECNKCGKDLRNPIHISDYEFNSKENKGDKNG